VAAAQHRSGEGKKLRRGGENSAGGRRLRFKGEGAEGWAPRGGRAGEREREGESRALGTAGSGRRETARLTGGPGHDRGPVVSG
jgi:hypothetical protein